MNTYEIYGYENHNDIVATINCDTLDDASAWAKVHLGAKGWSTIHKGS